MDNNITALKAKTREMAGLQEQQSRLMGEVLSMVNGLPETPEPTSIWTKVQSFKEEGDYADKDCYVHPYSPAQLTTEGLYSIYFYRKAVNKNKAGTNIRTATDSTAPRASIIRHNGTYYATDHVWLGNPKKCFGRWWKFNYAQWRWEMILQEVNQSGEDRGLIHTGEQWMLYQRKHPSTNREIEVRKSLTFPVTTPAEPVTFEGMQYHEKAYSAIPFILKGTLYVCVNVLSILTWSVYPRIYKMLTDTRGERPKTLILPETITNKQVFAIPTVIGDKVVITTIQCDDPHGSDDGLNVPQKPHYTQIYTADVNAIDQWLISL